MGQLLTDVGIDGDNAIFPIAYAAVESESGETWSWFLDYLKEDLSLYNDEHITWITDKEKGLLEVIKNMFSGFEHRFCFRHMYNNFKTEHKGLVLKQTLWNAARATTVQR